MVHGDAAPGGRHSKFVVLTTQRTGSSWLMDLLDKCPDTEGHMELFLNQRRLSPAGAGFNAYQRYIELRPAGPGGLRPFSVWRYLDDLYDRPGSVGFKLMYSQLRDYPEILPKLVARRIRIVHLVRRNHLDVLISERLAQTTGTSHLVRGERRSAQSVDIDRAWLRRRLRRLDRNERVARLLIRLSGLPWQEVDYESLLGDPGAFDAVTRFLGLSAPAGGVVSNLEKRQTRPRREVIANYADVAEWMRRLGREEWLVDA
jgi:LPS sulfotransferase NodH